MESNSIYGPENKKHYISKKIEFPEKIGELVGNVVFGYETSKEMVDEKMAKLEKDLIED